MESVNGGKVTNEFMAFFVSHARMFHSSSRNVRPSQMQRRMAGARAMRLRPETVRRAEKSRGPGDRWAARKTDQERGDSRPDEPPLPQSRSPQEGIPEMAIAEGPCEPCESWPMTRDRSWQAVHLLHISQRSAENESRRKRSKRASVAPNSSAAGAARKTPLPLQTLHGEKSVRIDWAGPKT